MKWNRILMSFFFLAMAVSANAQELVLVNQIDRPKRDGSPKQDQHRYLDRNQYFAKWLSNSEVLSFSEDLKIRVMDTENSNVKWAREWREGVRSWSVASSTRRLAIATKNNGVAVLNCDDGSTNTSVTRDWLAQKTGIENVDRMNVALSPIDARLIVARTSDQFGPHAFLLSKDLNDVENAIDTEGWVRKITTSDDGRRLITLTFPNVLSIRDIRGNWEIFQSGVVDREGMVLPNAGELVIIDAFHDGRDTLVYSKGGGCFSNGEICVYSIAEKKAVVFDSLNGWGNLDVDFRTQKIAVVGSSNFAVFDFTGKVLARLECAPKQPKQAIEFSPNAEKIMIYDRNSIHVFRVNPTPTETQDNKSMHPS